MHFINFRRACLLFSLTTLFTSYVYSQKNLQPGYLINLSGDSIKGQIDYRNWSENPTKITFISNADNSIKTYKPSDIREFGVKGEVYVSGFVKIEVSPYQISQLDENPEFKFETDSVFLLTIIGGEKSLYQLRARDKENLYVKSDKEFELLEYKTYIKNSMVTENKKYSTQLYSFLSNCDKRVDLIRKTSYDSKSLEKLFESYYKCTNTNLTYKKKKDKLKKEFGLLAGASVSSLELSYNDPYYEFVKNLNTTTTTSFAVGVYYNFIHPRKQGRWVFSNELIYTRFSISGTSIYERSTPTFYRETHDIKVGYSYLQLNGMLRFRLPIKKFNLFIEGGYSGSYVTLTENNLRIKTETPSLQIVKKEDLFKSTNKLAWGYIYGAGVDYNRFSLEVKQRVGAGVSRGKGDIVDKTIITYILLGYKLK